MNDDTAKSLSQFLSTQELNLKDINLKANNISDIGTEAIFYSLKNGPGLPTHNIQIIDMSRNNIGDYGASYISQSLISGRYPNLKSLDVSGNQITPRGYSYFAEGMKSPKVENFMVTFFKEATSVGKELIKPPLRDFVNYAKEQGINTTGVVTNKETYEYLKDGAAVSGKLACGYYKCIKHLDIIKEVDDMEVMPNNEEGIYVFTSGMHALYEDFVTPEGIDLIGKAIELIGE